MTDLLNWIAQNHTPAFFLGVFLIILAGVIATAFGSLLRFFQNLACAFTGKYPPPRPIVECDGDCNCNQPCKCCDEGECQVGCPCASAKDVE